MARHLGDYIGSTQPRIRGTLHCAQAPSLEMRGEEGRFGKVKEDS